MLSDLELTSVVSIESVENVTIIGHNNSVTCNNHGGVKFVSSSGITVEGITWDTCGTYNFYAINSDPVLEIYNSSNITIQNCTFRKSGGQAVALLDVQDKVIINKCMFIQNNYYKSHSGWYQEVPNYGPNSFLLYRSILELAGPFFSEIGSHRALIYINGFHHKSNDFISLRNCAFIKTQGVPIYASHHSVYIYGNASFVSNIGGSIFSNHSIIAFKKNSQVIIHGCIADYGVIYSANNSRAIFEGNSVVTVTNNTGTWSGAIYFTLNSHILFKENTTVTFGGNKAIKNGGYVSGSVSCIISFEGNSTVIFSDNSAEEKGGALYTAHNTTLLFQDKSKVSFIKNSAVFSQGGALYADFNSIIVFENCSLTKFTQNHAYTSGGAIYSNGSSVISFTMESIIMFFDNSVLIGLGGAIHSGMTSSIIVKSTVMFSRNHATKGGAISCVDGSDISFRANSNTTFTNNSATAHWGEKLGGAMFVSGFSKVSYMENSSVIFSSNTAADQGGAMFVSGYSKVSYMENSSVRISSNTAQKSGGAMYCHSSVNITFKENAAVTFSLNHARNHGGAMYCERNVRISFEGDSSIKFYFNTADYGGAVQSTWDTIILFTDRSTVTFSTNTVQKSGGAMYCHNSVNIKVEGNAVVIFSSNSATENGGAMHCARNVRISFEGYSAITFSYNTAQYGGAIQSFWGTIILFTDSSTALFSTNTVQISGGAIHCHNGVNIKFEGNAAVKFSSNSARNLGGAMNCENNVRISFEGISSITFTYNTANYGGAIRSFWYTVILFTDSSTANFIKNTALVNGGGMYSDYNCMISFQVNSMTTFSANDAISGGALVSTRYSNISFEDSSSATFTKNVGILEAGAIICSFTCNMAVELNSIVVFFNNTARRGGAFSCIASSVCLFQGKKAVSFSKNHANEFGGAIYFFDSNVAFLGDSSFSENIAWIGGGAIYCLFRCRLIFENNSTVVFSNNHAQNHGGAISVDAETIVLFTNNAQVTFYSNSVAEAYGGAIFSPGVVLFSGNSNTTFSNNSALRCGAVCANETVSNQFATITFRGNYAAEKGGAISTSGGTLSVKDHSSIQFIQNAAGNDGGAAHFHFRSQILFEGNSLVTFTNNKAVRDGAAIHADELCNVSFKDDSKITFTDNEAERHGGAIYTIQDSTISFADRSTITMINNRAKAHGGALYSIDNGYITFSGSSTVSFIATGAVRDGGAIYQQRSAMIFQDNTTVRFDGNAAHSGGAIYMDRQCTATFTNNSNVTFSHNRADGYGGAIYTTASESEITFKEQLLDHFFDNYARTGGDALYITVPELCNASCLSDRVVGVNNETLHHFQGVETNPNRVELYDPVLCISSNTRGECELYFINEIMLGQEIRFDACVFDLYDQQSSTVHVLVSGENNTIYHINGGEDALISCNSDSFQGKSITGVTDSSDEYHNYSITMSYNVNPFTDEKTFSIKLIVEISPCHPGFWYDKESQRCVCYNATDIVFCIQSTSSIKRGYWFGSVSRQPTVTACPINYCSFSCCETTDGYHNLSPLRSNQCRSHRSGPACGNCEEGWTLSFDSAECVKVDQCTEGQTALVVILTVIYWIAVVVAAFALMHYRIEIGYLYAISYYYSMLDILLIQVSGLSQGLYNAISTVSSVVKVTPQFLGKLCLTKGISGIDQQLIHYIHPLAITFILIAISYFSRISYKLTLIISREIIRVICLLLLLSYTSVATTSLLLIRPLSFFNVDKVYTYLSPDVEYFHGRHIAYVIVAVLCTLVIVVGLPMLLLLEPFINHKIFFFRIKPLLDQYQGCYKDRYRSFAAYYMICRLVIIITFITTPPNSSLAQYILLSFCVLIAAIQLVVRPYKHKLLNIFDGLLLMLMLVVVVLPVFDAFSTDLIVGISLGLILLPLVLISIMIFPVCKGKVKKLIVHCTAIPVDTTKAPIDNDAVAMKDVGVIVDDNMRKNATICDINELHRENAIHCQEPVMEVMDQIND